MSEFKFEELLLKDIIDKSILAGASKALNISKEIVPRDPKRPPKDLTQKVTGNLRRSLGMQKEKSGEYVIGVRKGVTEDYAFVQEFGSKDDKIPSRSYLRILLQNKIYSKEILDIIIKNLDHLLK